MTKTVSSGHKWKLANELQTVIKAFEIWFSLMLDLSLNMDSTFFCCNILDAQSPDEDDQLVQLEDILRFEQLKREENQRAGAGQNPHHRRFEDSYPTMGDGSLHTEL